MMRRRELIPIGSAASWRSLAPFAALFVLLMLLAVGGMLVIAREADRSDASRAREAVTRTFSAVLERLYSAAEMNADTTPVAGAMPPPLSTPLAAYDYLNFTSPDALGYYGAVVLNHDGSAFAGTRFGLPWTGPELAAAARMVAPIAARLPAKGAGGAHALIRDRSGQALAVAVVNVRPSGPDVIADQAAAPARRLALIAPIAVQVAPKMTPSLGVEDFRIVAARHDDNAVAIPVEHGAPVVFAWRPRSPGRAAVRRWAPAMAALLLTALVMLAIAARGNIRAIRSLEQLAHQDSLTGLANRKAFGDELDRRQARGESFALGMLDLNGFKAVNDEYGHVVGDALLQAVATELARSAGPGDFVARLGGDEFAWISPSHAAAGRLCETFAGRIARPFTVGPLSLRVGAAMGVALAHPGITASQLMALADARLYENKLASRNDGDDPPRRRRSGR
jgi:diguanylate cyclase (GGDEF)-like protein